MVLLIGANISVRQENDKFIAVASVGNLRKEVTASDPVRAVGLAVMLQAGYTENQLKKELAGKK